MYHEASLPLGSVAIDEATGKIAISNSQDIYIYRPYGREEGALKVNTMSKLPCIYPDVKISGVCNVVYVSPVQIVMQ